VLAALVLLSVIDSQTPSCDDPFRDGRVVKAVSLGYPDSAMKLNLGPLTVLVEVTVNPDGTLASSTIFRSSGNADVDQAALSEARASTYAPKLVDCKPVSGQYLFRAEFNPSASLLTPPFPTFTAPADWIKQPEQDTPGHPFAVWTSQLGTIWLIITATTQTLDENLASLRLDPDNSKVIDRQVSTCDGTQNARLFDYQRRERGGGASERIGVFAMRGGRQYAVLYVSRKLGTPDSATMASLLSMCAP
jgi:TonB family protein